MQAVETRYLGPTDSRGSRVKASAEAGSITLSWDDALNAEENHDAAARALIVKMGWADREWLRGTVPNARGNVYVVRTGWSVLSIPAAAVEADAKNTREVLASFRGSR